MDGIGRVSGTAGGLVARRTPEQLSVESSSVGSYSPVNSPSGVFRSVSGGSNGDSAAASAKLSSLYKEIGWLKIKLLSAGDGHSELQACLDSRVAEHAALLNQQRERLQPKKEPQPPPRETHNAQRELHQAKEEPPHAWREPHHGKSHHAQGEPHHAKEETHRAQEESQHADEETQHAEGFLARAKHGLAHMMHLDSEKEEVGTSAKEEPHPAKEEPHPAKEEHHLLANEEPHHAQREPHHAQREPHQAKLHHQPAKEEAHHAKEEPQHADEETHHAEGFVARAKHGLAHVMHLDTEKEDAGTYAKEETQHEEPHHAKEETHHAKEETYRVHRELHQTKEEPHHAKEKPHHAERQPRQAKEEPHHAKEQPRDANRQPHQAKEEPHHSKEEPHLGQEEPHHSKEEPQHTEEETQHAEGFLARAKHGIAHMLHLDTEKQEDEGAVVSAGEPPPSAAPSPESETTDMDGPGFGRGHAPTRVVQSKPPNRPVAGRIARSFPELVKPGNASAGAQTQTAEGVAEAEGFSQIPEAAGTVANSQGTELGVRPHASSEDASDAHAAPEITTRNTPFDGALATARKAAEAAAAAVHRATEAVSARANDGEKAAAPGSLWPASNAAEAAEVTDALEPAAAAHTADVAYAVEAADVVIAADAAEAMGPTAATEAAAQLEPGLAPALPPMPAAPPPDRNSKKQLVKLRGLMNTLQKEAQASHKERAALESRARRLDARLQAVQARTMRSERAEDERRKAEAEMATLRRALNARLRKEASRQPIVQPIPDMQAEGLAAASPPRQRSFKAAPRRDPRRFEMPEISRLSGDEADSPTGTKPKPKPKMERPASVSGVADASTPRKEELPLSARRSFGMMTASATEFPSNSRLRGCRLGPGGTPSTPRGESPFRQTSPPRRAPRRPQPSSPAVDIGATPSGAAHAHQRHPSDGSPEREPSPSEGPIRNHPRHNAHVWRQPSEGSDDGSSALEDENLKWHEPIGHAEASVAQQVFDRVRSDVIVNSPGGSHIGVEQHDVDSPGPEVVSPGRNPTKESTPSMMDAFAEGVSRRASGDDMREMHADGVADPTPACYVATWEDSERGTSEVATLPSTPAQPVSRETMSGSAHATVQSVNDGGASSGLLPCWTTSTMADQHPAIGPGAPGHERGPAPFSRVPVAPRGSAAFSELGTSTATAVAAAVASASAVLSHSRNSSAEFFDEHCGSRMDSRTGSASIAQAESVNTADQQQSSETGMAFTALAEEDPSAGYREGPPSMGPSPPAQQTRALAWRSPEYHGEGVSAGDTDVGAAAVVAAVASSAVVSSPQAATVTANGATFAAAGGATAANSSSGQSPLLRLWSPPPAPRPAPGIMGGDAGIDGKASPSGARGRANARSQSRRNSPSPGPGNGEAAGRGEAPATGSRAAPLAFGSRSPARGQQPAKGAPAGSWPFASSPAPVGRKPSPGQRAVPSAVDAPLAGSAPAAQASAATPAGTGATEGWHHRLASTHTKSSHARRDRRNSPSAAELLEEGAKLLESNQEPLRPFRRSAVNIGMSSRGGFR